MRCSSKTVISLDDVKEKTCPYCSHLVHARNGVDDLLATKGQKPLTYHIIITKEHLAIDKKKTMTMQVT